MLVMQFIKPCQASPDTSPMARLLQALLSRQRRTFEYFVAIYIYMWRLYSLKQFNSPLARSHHQIIAFVDKQGLRLFAEKAAKAM